MVLGMRLRFLNYAIHRDAAVGTNGRTRGTSDAGLGLDIGSVVIATVIDILGLQLEHIAGTRHYTKVATLASLAVYVNCT